VLICDGYRLDRKAYLEARSGVLGDWAFRRELASEEIGCHGLVVFAHHRARELLAPGPSAPLPASTGSSVSGWWLLPVAQILVNP
jgi:hypothetical protein